MFGTEEAVRASPEDPDRVAGKGFELFPISRKDRALSFIEEDKDLQAQLGRKMPSCKAAFQANAMFVEISRPNSLMLFSFTTRIP